MPNFKTALPRPIHLYLSICRHILRSSLHKNENKYQKNCVANLQPPSNQPQKIKAYPKEAHCVLMLSCKLVPPPLATISKTFSSLRKNALITITPTLLNFKTLTLNIDLNTA